MRKLKSIWLSLFCLFSLSACTINVVNQGGGENNGNENGGSTTEDFDYSKAIFKYRIGSGDFVTLTDENSTTEAKYKDEVDYYYLFIVQNANAGDTFKVTINGEFVSLAIPRLTGNNLKLFNGNDHPQFIEGKDSQRVKLFKLKNWPYHYVYSEDTNQQHGGETHTHCPGCNAEDVIHDICEHCGQYVCNGHDHTLRACGVHYNCVSDNLNHTICPDCGEYLCSGTHNHTVPEERYTISFDSNGGSGSMADIPNYKGAYTLPECEFNPPAGKVFSYWIINNIESVHYDPGDTYNIVSNTVIKAIWRSSGGTSHTYCPGCGAEDIEHDICEHCGEYTCNGEDHSLRDCGAHYNCVSDDLDHTLCSHCGEYLCNGKNHSVRPCGVHYYCVSDNLNHTVCSTCGGYLCTGNHDHTTTGPTYCPGCAAENIVHEHCPYCGYYLCVGDHSNCPPSNPPYTGFSGTFIYLFHYDSTTYFPYEDPLTGETTYGWVHAEIDLTLILTIDNNSGHLQILLGGFLPVYEADLACTNNGGEVSITINEYDKYVMNIVIVGNQDLSEYYWEHVSLDSPLLTTAYIYEDGSMLGLVSFLDHIGAFDPVQVG